MITADSTRSTPDNPYEPPNARGGPRPVVGGWSLGDWLLLTLQVTTPLAWFFLLWRGGIGSNGLVLVFAGAAIGGVLQFALIRTDHRRPRSKRRTIFGPIFLAKLAVFATFSIPLPAIMMAFAIFLGR